MIKTLLYCSLFASLFLGCKKKDLTPSWVKLDNFILQTNEATQGDNTHGITDAWVYMDGQALGVFPLPAVFPILDEGSHKFVIYPGIKKDGISSKRVRYPFYKSFDVTAELSLNDTLALSPITTYEDEAIFSYIEDFEDASISIDKESVSDTNIVFVLKSDSPDIVVHGDKCGAVFLNANDSIYAGSTNAKMPITRISKSYLEIDYRNNNSIGMGVIANYPAGSPNRHTPLVFMNRQKTTTPVWKKIYIELTEDVSYELQASSYDIYFIASLDEANDTISKDANIYIDNIKVVHF